MLQISVAHRVPVPSVVIEPYNSMRTGQEVAQP